MRKFECPFCSWVHIFTPTGKSKNKKTFVGFTCLRCHKKVTEDDIKRIKGRGPKPPGERRKRVKKEVVEDTSIAVVHPPVEQFYWRTGDEGPRERQRYPVKPGWRSKPAERTLEEATVVMHLSKPERRKK